MDWVESINKLQGKDGQWSAYINQDNRGCGWRVYHNGSVVGAGFSESISMAKERVEDLVKHNKG